MKRITEIFASVCTLIILLPLFIIIAFLIVIDSKGGVFYCQKRVGKDNIDFNLFKFRTMKINCDSQHLLTLGDKDARVTRVGYYLRKSKFDEFPQLINIIKGEMSIVGPRPEVRKYVDLYTAEQIRVLSVRPGLTDYASIEYINEEKILANSDNPEKEYIEKIMPHKIALNLSYIQNQSWKEDAKIILKTLSLLIQKR